jgi:hypothetical protein
MKMEFSELFEINNNLIQPKFTVKLGGVTLEKGKSYREGASATGADLIKHRNSTFDVTKDDQNVYVINTIYD